MTSTTPCPGEPEPSSAKPTLGTFALPGASTFLAPMPDPLRKAAAEALLAGALLLSDVQRENSGWNAASQAKQSEERFRKALEAVREALA